MKTEEKQNLPYGICPICGAKGINRERRLNGDDMCSNFHSYPSKDAVKVNGDTINRMFREQTNSTQENPEYVDSSEVDDEENNI